MDEQTFFWILGLFIAVFAAVFMLAKTSIIELRRRVVEPEKTVAVLKHKQGID